MKFNLHEISDACPEEHVEPFVSSHGSEDTEQHHENEPGR